MSVVRGTALANYPSLVAGLGGDPATLLRAAGVRDQDVGNYDAFISIRAAIRAIGRSGHRHNGFRETIGTAARD